MSRRKRASMREGPLADLFRSTSDDAADAEGRSTAGPAAAGARQPPRSRERPGGGPPATSPAGEPSTSDAQFERRAA